MTVAENKQVVANFIEVCQNQHNLAAAEKIFTLTSSTTTCPAAIR